MRLAAALLCLFSAGLARASVIEPLDDAGLAQRADTIAFGTVLHTESVAHANGFVTTRAEVQVMLALRGAKPMEVIVVEVPGGVLGRVVADVAGSPKLKVGDMVFGFMVTKDGTKRPLGMSFGLLRVFEKARGDLRVYRELDGLTLVSPTGGVSPEPYVIEGVPLEAFTEHVRDTLKRARPEVKP